MTTPDPQQDTGLILPTVTQQLIPISDGSTLTISGHVAADAAGRRLQVKGAHLYFIGGLLADPHDAAAPAYYACAYAGKSMALYRAAASYLKWVTTMQRIRPAGIGLLHREEPYRADYLSYVEAALISALSTGPGDVCMLNTHTSALLAGDRLSHIDIAAGQAVATEIATHLWRSILGTHINPHPAPASNRRELAVRAIRHADRALDVPDIVAAMHDAGYYSAGATPEFSTRRDLMQREIRGIPRIHGGWHRHRRLFWRPDLPTHIALARYDRAKPSRRTLPSAAPVTLTPTPQPALPAQQLSPPSPPRAPIVRDREQPGV